MNPVRAELGRLQGEAHRLDAQRMTAQAALNAALDADPDRYRASDVREGQATVRRIEQQLAAVTDRIEALNRQLPSSPEVADAELNASQLILAAKHASRAAAGVWPEFQTVLSTAERLAREFAAHRTAATTARAHLTDLVERFDLRVSIPTPWSPAPNDLQIATHIAMLLEDVTSGSEPTETVELYLRDARAARAEGDQREHHVS